MISASQSWRAASSCTSCRLTALQLFVGQTLPQRTARAGVRATRSLRPATASFSTSRPALQNDVPSPSIIELRTQKEKDGSEKEDGSEEVPWYLEVEPPKHPTLVVEAPPLPDVPEGAPKVMEPLVKFTSEALGLDEIKILDLRKLDPPPALGPNLLMIFGTARSERHLHVCADRLVRWFRKHGITAAADGLLGRNELRTKEKRLARKMKRMGSGYSRSEDDDDGISTQWVCVNAGTVGGPEAPVENTITSADGRVVGFGVPQTGSTIVVQMFMAARREELNLEGFWKNKIMTPEERRAKKEAERLADPFSAIQPADTKRSPGGARHFSTSARRRQGEHQVQDAQNTDQLADILAHQLSSRGVADQVEGILQWDVDQKLDLLDKMKEYALALTQAKTPGKEGGGGADTVARFVRLYRLAMENLPPATQWEYRLWLTTTGRNHHWPGFDLQSVADLVHQMRTQGLERTRTQYVDLFEAIYIGHETENGDIVREQSKLAMEVVDTMFERGLDVLSNDAIVSMVSILVQARARGPEVDKLKTNLQFLLTETKLPYMGEHSLMKLLDAHASVGDWDKFWEVWRIPPRFAVARSAALYTYMWLRITQTNSQAQCIKAVRTCFHEMLNEEPPVQPVGQVRDALIACIMRADRKAMAIALDPGRGAMTQKHEQGREFVRFLVDIGVAPKE